ncbi:MAG: hypothetical protein QJR09_03185 [Micrococcus sp.]|nr:hypothetical protein [Micrococcus sp.]
MTADLNTPATTDRPATRRRVRRALTAVAISGALLVPTAAVTVAAPFGGFPAVSADAKGNGNGKGNGPKSERSFTECVATVNPSGNGQLTPAVIMKGTRCLSIVGGLSAGSLTVAEATDLVDGALVAVETAGFDRSQIPGLLDTVSDSDVLLGVAGEQNAGLIALAADSELLALYAGGELSREEASQRIAEAFVAQGGSAAE